MHIVLVDGSRTGLMILYRMLEPRGDTITMFMDGQDALEFIRETPDADLLITSFEIGTITGSELCWEARVLADGGRPLYVIAMSSSSDPSQVIGVLDAGADDFVSKPPRQDELHARLRVAERTVAMQRRLIELATLDELTGLFNRRAFRERTDAAVADLPTDVPVSLILFDVDHFRRINDHFGHDVGDRTIGGVGRLRVPPDALFARFGGAEFAVLLPGVPLEAAASVAEHLRSQVEALDVATAEGTLIQVTASFGVAELAREAGLAAVFKAAGDALEAAKTGGRNRVATAT